MNCRKISPSTMPATASHFTTRHQARKYDVAAFVEPVIMKPNSQTHASMAAPASNPTRN